MERIVLRRLTVDPYRPVLARALVRIPPHGPGPALSHGTLGYPKWVAHRDSQVPGEPLPYLCPALRLRPVRQTSRYRPTQCSPRYSEHEDTSDTYFGTQS